MSSYEVVYGRNPVREALRGPREVARIWVAAGGGGPRAKAGGRAAGEIEEWLGTDLHRGGSAAPVERVAPERLSELLGTDEHQGVGAQVAPYPYRSPDEIWSTHDLIVVLDRVQDPHNLGAVIRTAEGAGAAVVVPRHRSAHVTPAVVKSSAGATEHAAVCRVRNTADFLIESRDAGFWSHGAAGEAGPRYDEQDYSGRTIFVLGSEAEGLSPRVSKECDVLVRIPLAGAMTSLNVSVACGVLLFEAGRQRGFAGDSGGGGAAGGSAGSVR